MSSPKLTLYYSPGACSLAPHILLHELSLVYTPVELHVFKGFPKEYLHINPKGKVPILILSQDGSDEIITEAPAVMTAISQLKPEAGLFGRSNLDTVRVYEWMNWISGTLHAQAFGGIWRPARFIEDESAFDGVKAKGMKAVQECFEIIEGKLAKKETKGSAVEEVHAVGDYFTAVDAYLFVFFRWGSGLLKLEMLKRFPRYTALARGMSRRPSTEKALEVEKQESFVPKI